MKINLKNKKVLVTGGHGFVGNNLLELLKKRGYQNFIAPTKEEYDLTKEKDVKSMFKELNPEIVIHLAGKVGGIAVNKARPGEFFYENLMMGTLVLEHAKNNKVEKLVALAAGCGYPNNLNPPYKEEDFWMGLPEPTSLPYSMAKKMLIVQSWAYRKQYNFNSSILLPSNLYGPHDNFDLENSHVVPALIRKFVEATIHNQDSVEIWGTGKASREFLYVKDACKAIIKIASKYHETGPLNLGTGKETPIRTLVDNIKKYSGFSGKITWNTSRPDGQMRRKFDMKKLKKALDYRPQTTLNKGIKETINWYKKNRKEVLKKY